MKKICSSQNQSSGCFLEFETYRRVIFGFSRVPKEWLRWHAKPLRGFNHICLILPLGNGLYIVTEPVYQGAQQAIIANPNILSLNEQGYVFVEAHIRATDKNRLVRPLIQTCTTLTQYLAGISLGCITAQGLYNKLTKSSPKWLRRHGVMEVNKWDAEV